MIREIVIPKVWGHDLELSMDGVGSRNPKEYCKCTDCKSLRKRRDSIYKQGWIYRYLKS